MPPVALLSLASLALLVGPLCGAVGARSRAVRELVDGFALVLIAGLCLVFVLPHVVEEIGFAGVALLAAGFLLPWLGHRLGREHVWSLGLVATAVAVHVVLDGAVLSTRAEMHPLGWAVVAHRLPEGFAIVVAVRASRQPLWVSWALALAMILATVGGFVAGPVALAEVPETGSAALEALVAGVLLHVVFMPHGAKAAKGHHGHEHGEPGQASQHHHGHGAHDAPHHHDDAHQHGHHGLVGAGHGWAAAGTLIGLLALGGAFFGAHGPQSGVLSFAQTLGVLVLESAPALLLGFALAGVVPFVLTPARTTSLGRGGKLMQSLRGVAFGLPLPVCSCGVLPLYESLMRRGAPPVAAMAFFVATPELGLDAVLLSVPLLGSSMTVARVASAFAVALLVGLLVGGRSSASSVSSRTHSEPVPGSAHESWRNRIHAGLRFGFVEVFDHTMPWIALGLVIAAMAEPMLSHGAIGSIPPVLQVPLAALAGVPVYVCASGATPVAALALHKGLSTGAAIAFLIAGPATNITTFGVLSRLHGRKTAALFGVSVTALAVLAGWTVDVLAISATPVLDAHAGAKAHGSWFAWLCVAGLAVATMASLVRQGPRGALRQIVEPFHAH